MFDEEQDALALAELRAGQTLVLSDGRLVTLQSSPPARVYRASNSADRHLAARVLAAASRSGEELPPLLGVTDRGGA